MGSFRKTDFLSLGYVAFWVFRVKSVFFLVMRSRVPFVFWDFLFGDLLQLVGGVYGGISLCISFVGTGIPERICGFLQL
jgi:hypothetical protein